MKTMVFDIGGTSVKYGVCVNGKLIKTHEMPTNASLGGPHIMEMIKSILFTEAGFQAIGVSTAGQVNTEDGSVIYANNNIPLYTGTRIQAELEAVFHVPVAVENDVNAAALGEAICGAGKDYEDFLCLTYGTGVGGAIVQHRQVYHGSSFSAGEFGGIVTHGSVKLSGEGQDVFDGCYERFASTTALVKAAGNLDAGLKNGRMIFERLSDDCIRPVIDHWIGEVLLGLVTLIHIFNPSCVILGGGVMSQSYIIGEIRRRLPSMIMPSFSHVKVEQAALGNTAGMLGADYLARKRAGEL